VSSEHTWLRGDGMSIRQVARKLGVTPMRVQQLERSALKKLRRNPGLLLEFVRGCFEPLHMPGAKEGADR
jgi:DNA-directed RNA polymerase sigma subunit (sigma70/sigma32)